jgi:hypothetical protein
MVDALLSQLLGPMPVPVRVDSIEALDAASRRSEEAVLSSIERAILAGFAADRLGYAFAGGYRAALTRLVPGVARRACLAATEAGGGHPRAIRTTLREDGQGAFLLDGNKSFVTLGTAAEELLVVASTGESEGKNRLVVVRVPATRQGIVLTAGPALPFVPEIPHAEATFKNVHIAPNEVLPGDGYDRYLKPFRTIEDLHVLAATVGYCVSLARRFDFGHGAVEDLCALVLGLCATEACDPSASGTHVALAGLFTRVRAFLASPEIQQAMTNVDPEERARFERDWPLLRVAEKARTARLDTAWKKLSDGHGKP